MKIIYISILLLLLAGCGSDDANNSSAKSPDANDSIVKETIISEGSIVNPEANVLEGRYSTPEGYNRVEVSGDSFGEFLRNSKLKPYGEKVLYYDGREKNRQNVYDSVFDVDIGDRDLHQCADAIMLLRAEYLYSLGLYDKIHFNFVSGFKAEFTKWMEGYRIKVDGNTAGYYPAAEPSDSYETFRKYMDMVFAYSGTISLANELDAVPAEQMEIGDVFIVGGSPGHAIIVVDAAANEMGDKIFLLAQSYMPAQQTHILLNPSDKEISPWYRLRDGEQLIAPEWTFAWDDLRRFKN
ncbi:MAG TPA: DUF4846 domain-containing protein [Bacillota bacterium]|nr:DUF4846 domain-containing protein [Bacillota bacterium]